MSSHAPFKPAYGPIEKGDATWHFEQLIKDLLHHNTHEVSYNQNGEMTIIVNHHFYNLTQILLHEPDFELLQFSQEDIAAYHELIKNIQGPLRKKAFAIDESTRTKIFPEMSNEEASAVRYYTDDCSFYRLVNHLYRHHAVKPFDTNQYDDLPDSLLEEIADEAHVQLNTDDFLNVIIKEVLIHSAIALFGLSKNYFKHIGLYFVNSTFNFESHQDSINGPGLILKRLENQYENPSPVETNISEELCTSIPSSALRAPSPHAWGEGKMREVLWEARVFAYGKFLKKTALIPLKEIVDKASEPESVRKKNPLPKKMPFRLFGKSCEDEVSTITENNIQYYFSFNEKEQLFNVLEEFDKKDLIEFESNHPLMEKLCFFLRQQPEIQELFYETVIRVEQVDDYVLANVNKIKQEIKKNGWGMYRTEGFQGAFGDSENYLEVYRKHGRESDCDLFKKIKIPISYVKNIESISSVLDEAERVILSGTQVIFTSYKHSTVDDNDVYELDGKVFRSIDSTHPSSYSRAHVALREILAFELPCIIQEIFFTINNIDKEQMEILQQLLEKSKTQVLTIFSENNIRQQNKPVIELLHHIELLAPELKKMISDGLPEELMAYFNFQVNTSRILEKLIDYFPENFPDYVPCDQTDRHIKDLVDLANNRYSDQSYYGGDALNRQFLLDADVANLLDQKTIQSILFNKSKRDNKISVNREIASDLADILLYGFKDKQLLQWVNPNYDSYGLTGFEKQQSDYEKNTKRIIHHIMSIEKNVVREDVDQDTDVLLLRLPSCKKLYDRLVDIKMAIADIIQDQEIGINKLLFIEADNTPEELFSQCQRRLERIGKHFGYQIETNDKGIYFRTPDTLAQFVEKFLSRNELVFHSKIMHFFYDKIHLLSCLVASRNLSIGSSNYRFSDVIEEIIKQCDQLPESHYACQQFSLRIQQIEDHLKQNKEFALHYHPRIFLITKQSESKNLRKTPVQKVRPSKQFRKIEALDNAICFKDASAIDNLIQVMQANRLDINYIYKDKFKRNTNIVLAAVMYSTVDILKKIIQFGAKIDHPQLKRSPLDLAITLKRFEMVETLINAGAKLQFSSVLAALKTSSPEIGEYLLQQHSRFNQVLTWVKNDQDADSLVPKVIEVMNHYYEKKVTDLLREMDKFIRLKSGSLSDKNKVRHHLSVQEQINKVIANDSLTIIDKLKSVIEEIHNKYISLFDQMNVSSCRTDDDAEASNLYHLLHPVRQYMHVCFNDDKLSIFSQAVLDGGVMLDNDALKKYRTATLSSECRM